MICFFGLSGVGKTTLMSNLYRLGGYDLPVFTVTRKQRPDDDPQRFAYVSVEEYLDCRDRNGFALDMDDGVNYYGYQNCHVGNSNCLVYGSPYHLGSIKARVSKTVLIEGDAETGLRLRGSTPSVIAERMRINTELAAAFYSRPEFRSQIDVVFLNDFSDPVALARSLIRALEGNGG
jgi:guanylate kinase